MKLINIIAAIYIITCFIFSGLVASQWGSIKQRKIISIMVQKGIYGY